MEITDEEESLIPNKKRRTDKQTDNDINPISNQNNISINTTTDEDDGGDDENASSTMNISDQEDVIVGKSVSRLSDKHHRIGHRSSSNKSSSNKNHKLNLSLEDDDDEEDEEDEDGDDNLTFFKKGNSSSSGIKQSSSNNNKTTKSNSKSVKRGTSKKTVGKSRRGKSKYIRKKSSGVDTPSSSSSTVTTASTTTTTATTVPNVSSPSSTTTTTSNTTPPLSTTTTTTTTTNTKATARSTSPVSKAPRSRQQTSPTPSQQQQEESKPNGILYHCDYCQKDISGVVRIRCSVCQDFDLCLECFSVGVEISPHKNYHDYHVVENMHFPMFTEDWGADEELLLLEGIEMYGMGNWNDVAENVGSKSAPECKSHYFTYYINSATSPLPDVSKVLTTRDDVQFRRAKSSNVNTSNEKITRDRGKSKTGNKSVGTNQHQDGEGPSGPVIDSVGFMKNRGHFEHEHDNEAEIVVKDLTFEPDDTPEDREIKLQILESYNERLDERIRRRNFIIEKGLLDYKKIERKRFKDDKEIYNNLKVFLQTMSKEDHEKLVNGLIIEKNVKNRIEQLQMYRENGIKTLNEGSIFDDEKRKRETEKQYRKSKSDLGYFQQTEKPLGNLYKTPKQQSKEKEEMFLGINKGSSASEQRKLLKLRKNVQMEMEGLPNVDSLSLKEKQLCSNIRLLPHQYLLIKETILSESLKSGGKLKVSAANKLIRLHTSKVQKIMDFFDQSGWLKKVDSPLLQNQS
eukprot:gene1249-1576_t